MPIFSEISLQLSRTWLAVVPVHTKRNSEKAREIALEELEDWAAELGANAVVGVDYESFGRSNGMLMVSVSGTAVITE